MLDGVLEATGDAATRAARLEAAAEHAPAEVGPWAWAAAHAWREAGETEREFSALGRAAATGFWPASVELSARVLGAAQPELASDLIPADDLGGAFRLALVLERAGRAPEAVRALHERLAAAGVGVARDAIERALERLGDKEAVLVSREAAVAAWDVPRPFDVLLLAEAHEAVDPGSPEALRRFAQAAEKGDLEALRGLARVARAAGDEAARADALVRLADLEPDPALRAARATEAGQALLALGRVDEGVVLLERAGQAEGGKALALEATAAALARKRPEAAAEKLEAHAATLEGIASSTWWLEAAHLRAAAGDAAGAVGDLEALLAQVPGHEAALRRLGRGASVATPERLKERLALEGTALARELAASVDLVVGQPLSEDAPEALRAIEAARDADTWRAWIDARAALGDPDARVAWAVLEASATPEAVATWMDGAEGPRSRLLARCAERLGRGARAWAFLGEATGPDDLRRAAAAGAYDVVEAAVERKEASLARLVDLGRASLAPERRRKALEAAVALAEAPGLRTWLHGEVATLCEATGRPADAVRAWQAVLAERPASPLVRHRALTSAAASGDAAAVKALAEAVPDLAPREVALALDATAPAASIEAWRAAAAEGELVDRLGLEGALTAAEAWEALFDAWTERRAVTEAPEERDRLERKRRWLLAEKLAASERAWELYVALHEEQPEDREITESLARIAGARGDLDQALGYLRELADTAGSEHEAARLYRRIAEVLGGAGRHDEARQALLDALTQAPDDLDALAALRELAERTDDAATLLLALQREVALASGSRQIDLRREIARVAQGRADDAAQAVDAWRAVLAAVPGDLEALRGLVGIATRTEDDALLLEFGEPLARRVAADERTDLLRALGERCLASGRDDQGIAYLEEAVEAVPPDARAAELLEEVHRQRGDLDGLVRALLARATVADGEEARVGHLRDAARIESDARHDREAAHRIYARLLDHLPEDREALRFEVRYAHAHGEPARALSLGERLAPLVEAEEDLEDLDVRVDQSDLRHLLGEILVGDGRATEARAHLEAGLTLNPNHLPTLVALGPLYAAEADWKRTGEVYGRLLLLSGGRGDPERVADTYTHLGLVDLHEGREARASARFARALEAFPNFVPALKGTAELLGRGGDWQGALNVYNDVIYNATRPEDIMAAYATKARILDAELGRPDKAAQHYERTIVYDADQPEAYLRLAEIGLREGRWDDALDWAARGLAFADRAPRVGAELQLVVVMARARTEDAEGAAAAAEAVEQLDPSLAAEAEVARHDPERAAAALFERLRG